jgi:hypothetical protein
MIRKVQLFTAFGLLATVLGCARGPDAPPLVATEFEELEATADGERMLKVTVRSLTNESVDVELDPLPSQKETLERTATAVLRCSINEKTPSCNLVFPVDTFLNNDSTSTEKDSATFWLSLTRQRLFGKHAQQRSTYRRGDVAYVDSGNSIVCRGTLTCSSFVMLDGAKLAFKARSPTSPVTVSDPTRRASPGSSLPGAEAVLLLDPGAVFAHEPLNILEGIYSSRRVSAPVTLQVGDAKPVAGEVSTNREAFADAVLAAVRKKLALPGYLVPPEDQSRRALLVISESGDKGVRVVGDSGATFDDLDTFAVMETVKKESVDCGAYTRLKDFKNENLSGTLETVRVTVVERASGEVLGTKVMRARGNPCTEKTTGPSGMGLLISIEAAADFASTL